MAFDLFDVLPIWSSAQKDVAFIGGFQVKDISGRTFLSCLKLNSSCQLNLHTKARNEARNFVLEKKSVELSEEDEETQKLKTYSFRQYDCWAFPDG